MLCVVCRCTVNLFLNCPKLCYSMYSHTYTYSLVLTPTHAHTQAHTVSWSKWSWLLKYTMNRRWVCSKAHRSSAQSMTLNTWQIVFAGHSWRTCNWPLSSHVEARKVFSPVCSVVLSFADIRVLTYTTVLTLFNWVLCSTFKIATCKLKLCKESNGY